MHIYNYLMISTKGYFMLNNILFPLFWFVPDLNVKSHLATMKIQKSTESTIDHK